jgi:uncharacterized protein YoxC
MNVSRAYLRKTVNSTDKAVDRIEKDIGELKVMIGELKGVTSALLAHVSRSEN